MRLPGLIPVLGLLMASALHAEGAVLLRIEESRETRQHLRQTHTVPAPAPGHQLGIRLISEWEAGTGSLVLRDSTGEAWLDIELGVGRVIAGQVFEQLPPGGTFTLDLDFEGFRGRLRAVVVEVPERHTFYPFLLPGPLILLIALSFVLGWKWRTRVELHWFTLGAMLWLVGVALKFLWVSQMNTPILGFLQEGLPTPVYLLLGSVYIGSLTGVFEIGVTLAGVLLWRAWALSANRAIAIGLGAGAFEAFVYGLQGVFSGFLMMSSAPQAELMLVSNLEIAASTPLIWLCGPVERVIAILCHAAARVLVLLAVASNRPSLFFYGFLLLSVVDMIVGSVHLAGLMGALSLWWVQLALAPLGLASIPILRWCALRWPQPETIAPETPRGQ